MPDTSTLPRPDEEALPRLAEQLIAVMRETDVEDCVTHPGEVILDRAFAMHGATAGSWIATLMNDPRYGDLAPSILRLLGRLWPLTPAWRAERVRNALGAKELALRDAALQAAESWGERDAAIVGLLRDHEDSVPWLADYARCIVANLSGQAWPT